MNKVLQTLSFALVGVAFAASLSFAAGERATKEEAQAMVKKAVAAITKDGAEKTYADIDKADGPYKDRDLYIVVYDNTGKCVAHGANAKLIGKDLMDSEDADGKAYVKERVEMAKTQASFWQDYKFADPISKKISPKQTYCEKLNDTIVCGGVYKP